MRLSSLSALEISRKLTSLICILCLLSQGVFAQDNGKAAGNPQAQAPVAGQPEDLSKIPDQSAQAGYEPGDDLTLSNGMYDMVVVDGGFDPRDWTQKTNPDGSVTYTSRNGSTVTGRVVNGRIVLTKVPGIVKPPNPPPTAEQVAAAQAAIAQAVDAKQKAAYQALIDKAATYPGFKGSGMATATVAAALLVRQVYIQSLAVFVSQLNKVLVMNTAQQTGLLQQVLPAVRMAKFWWDLRNHLRTSSGLDWIPYFRQKADEMRNAGDTVTANIVQGMVDGKRIRGDIDATLLGQYFQAMNSNPLVPVLFNQISDATIPPFASASSYVKDLNDGAAAAIKQAKADAKRVIDLNDVNSLTKEFLSPQYAAVWTAASGVLGKYSQGLISNLPSAAAALQELADANSATWRVPLALCIAGLVVIAILIPPIALGLGYGAGAVISAGTATTVATTVTVTTAGLTLGTTLGQTYLDYQDYKALSGQAANAQGISSVLGASAVLDLTDKESDAFKAFVIDIPAVVFDGVMFGMAIKGASEARALENAAKNAGGAAAGNVPGGEAAAVQPTGLTRDAANGLQTAKQLGLAGTDEAVATLTNAADNPFAALGAEMQLDNIGNIEKSVQSARAAGVPPEQIQAILDNAKKAGTVEAYAKVPRQLEGAKFAKDGNVILTNQASYNEAVNQFSGMGIEVRQSDFVTDMLSLKNKINQAAQTGKLPTLTADELTVLRNGVVKKGDDILKYYSFNGQTLDVEKIFDKQFLDNLHKTLEQAANAGDRAAAQLLSELQWNTLEAAENLPILPATPGATNAAAGAAGSEAGPHGTQVLKPGENPNTFGPNLSKIPDNLPTNASAANTRAIDDQLRGAMAQAGIDPQKWTRSVNPGQGIVTYTGPNGAVVAGQILNGTLVITKVAPTPSNARVATGNTPGASNSSTPELDKLGKALAEEMDKNGPTPTGAAGANSANGGAKVENKPSTDQSPKANANGSTGYLQPLNPVAGGLFAGGPGSTFVIDPNGLLSLTPAGTSITYPGVFGSGGQIVLFPPGTLLTGLSPDQLNGLNPVFTAPPTPLPTSGFIIDPSGNTTYNLPMFFPISGQPSGSFTPSGNLAGGSSGGAMGGGAFTFPLGGLVFTAPAGNKNNGLLTGGGDNTTNVIGGGGYAQPIPQGPLFAFGESESFTPNPKDEHFAQPPNNTTPNGVSEGGQGAGGTNLVGGGALGGNPPLTPAGTTTPGTSYGGALTPAGPGTLALTNSFLLNSTNTALNGIVMNIIQYVAVSLPANGGTPVPSYPTQPTTRLGPPDRNSRLASTHRQTGGSIRLAVFHPRHSLLAFSPRGLTEFLLDEQPQAGAFGKVIYSIVANGNSSGQALELQAYDPSGHLQDPGLPEGVVLEPVKQGSAKSVDEIARGADILRKPLVAYCVEFAKLPPEVDMLYRLAPQAVQDKFGSIRPVLEAGRELAAAGKFHPDSDPQTYMDSIRQYALWSKIENWDQQKFGEVFLDKTKQNASSAKVKWTKQMEQSLMSLVPGRWRDISMVLDEAAKSSNRPSGPGSPQ